MRPTYWETMDGPYSFLGCALISGLNVRAAITQKSCMPLGGHGSLNL